MNILHIVHQYRPHFVGGTEIYTQKLATYQAAQGHNVAVVAPTPEAVAPAYRQMEDGVHVWRVPTGARGRGRVFLAAYGEPALTAALMALLAGVDLVHVEHLMGWPLDALDAVRAAGIPYVITLHDYWFVCANAQLLTNYDQTLCSGPDAYFHNCGRCFLARAGLGDRPAQAGLPAPLLAGRNRRLRAIFDGAAAVIAVSDFVRRAFLQNGYRHPHFYALPTSLIADAQMVDRPHSDGNGLHVVFVGNLAWHKGVHVLVEAFNQLPAAARLSIAGGGDAFPDYLADLRARSRHPGIALLGHVPHEQLADLLATADVAVMPTLWYEAWGLAVDEQLAAGVPVIASAIGALPEKIWPGVNGLLVPPGDVAALANALWRLIDEPTLRATLRAGTGLPRTLAEHAAAVEQVYRTALSG